MFLTLFISALSLGFLGSLHCVGMCGPIALSLPVGHLKGAKKTLGILSYNFGRVFTYAVLGLAFGLIGQTFSFFATQQILSIILGSVMLLIFILAIFRKRMVKNSKMMQKWSSLLSKTMAPLFRNKNPFMLTVIGLLNGLLPCGLVYMAIAGALAFASPLESSIFMAVFGLGTLPAMAALSFAGNTISLSFRNTIRKATPYIIAVMGAILIIRGMNLNIPYISPVAHSDKIECCEK